MVIGMYKLSMSFNMHRTVEKTYLSVTLGDMLKEFNLATDLDDITAVRLWSETTGEQSESILMKTWYSSSQEIKPALQDTSDTIGMSMHFDEAAPVAVCLVVGCQQHFYGDSRNDAMMVWSKHVDKDHKNDWGDD